MELIQYPQEKHDTIIAEKIIELENTAWPQENEENNVFPSAPNTYVTSFVLIEKECAVCHVGIRKSILHHKGNEYSAYGLSEVVTRPQYRNRGLAFALVEKATQFIISQRADIGIFTCAKARVSFYSKAGWKAISGACFVGGTKEHPFRSDSLDLVTMMMFISLESRLHRKDFENTDITFLLGKDQLW